MGSRLTLVFTWSHILFTQRRVVARSAARVSDTRGPELPDANNTDRQLKIFPLEYPLVKVSIGTRKPLRFTPDIERFDLTSFRITVPLGQFRAIFSADMPISCRILYPPWFVYPVPQPKLQAYPAGLLSPLGKRSRV